jgi:hypothetical protein
MIRHAGLRPAASIITLTIPMIEFSFGTLLMTAVGRSPLLSAGFIAAVIAAVLLPAIAMPADPEKCPAMPCAAKPLTQNKFDYFFHSPPEGETGQG